MKIIFLCLTFCIVINLHSQTSAAAKKAVATFNGATIATKIIRKMPIFFSNEKMQDTLILTVGEGLLSKSISNISIKAADKKILLEENFSTRWFATRVFDDTSIHTPEQINGVTDFDKHVLAIPKATITTYTKKQINQFLKSIIRFGKKLECVTDEGCQIVDSKIYNYLMKNPILKAVFIPDFEVGGGAVYAYSAKEKVAVVITQIPD